jgi:AraC family transcriptional regulator, arabinose operon regulatory protein
MPEQPNSPIPPQGQLTTGLFRMRGEYSRWRKYGAPGWLIVYTLAGKGRFSYSRGELITSEGDLVLLAPKTLNDYGLEATLKSWDLLWAYFFPRGHWHELLQWPHVAPGLMHLRLAPANTRKQIVSLFQKSYQLNTSPRRHREILAMNALEQVLLCCDDINPLWDQTRFDARVLRAMEYLCENYSRPITIAAVANHCGISGSRLAHLFRRQSGQTMHQFLEQERITRARQLLELTQESVTNIGAEVGFDDLFHFSRRFKHLVGVSPRAYRQRVTSFPK